MSKFETSLVALTVKKWELDQQKVYLNSYTLYQNEEHIFAFDVKILPTGEMVEQFLQQLSRHCSEKFTQKGKANAKDVVYDNESFLRQKLSKYFQRISSELNNPRRKKGQPRAILTTELDIYGPDQDISFLPKELQYFVTLNWARRFYDKEKYKEAIDPLRRLVKLDPRRGIGYQLLARSLKKIRKYDEAMRQYEKYAEVDGSIDAKLDLAKSYRKGKLFEKSDALYAEILSDAPNNRDAQIGVAQIRYAQKDSSYMQHFDALHKKHPKWLKQWLVEEFNFRIYVSDKTLLSPVQAAKFLGYSKIFELTQRAFQNDLPSHFNPSRARLSFYREELENWAEVMNRFKCLKETVRLYPGRLDNSGDDELEVQPATAQSQETTAKVDPESGKPLTRVEEILLHIRQRKAQRQAEQAALAEVTDAEQPPKPSRAKVRNTRKRKPPANRTAATTVKKGGRKRTTKGG